MITNTKVKQLEDKYDTATRSGKHKTIVRRILQDGRYLNEKGQLLNKEEVKCIKKGNRELWKIGGMVINLVDFSGNPKG